MKKLLVAVACLSSFLLVSCSEAPAPKPEAKKEPEKPAEPISGKNALYKMYQVARANWSADAMVLKMNSIRLSDVTAEPGKSGAWQATFTSAQKGQARTYTYSVAEESGNLHKGTYAAGDQSFSGQGSFDIRSVSTDSDAAYNTAMEKAGDYPKKNPDMPITFTLEKISKFPTPAWRVIWGESVGTSNFSIYVDASLGKFLEKMH